MSRPFTFVPPPGAVARRLDTERGDFAVVDAQARTDRTGPPKGTVLLVPGYTGSKEDFIALHEPLAGAGYRTVAVDGRGQYESWGPDDDEAPYGMAELARDVHAQAAAVGAPVHLVGHSLGGLVARAAVLLDATPFRSLTLISCGPGEVSEAQQHRVKLLRDVLAVHTMAEVWDVMQRVQPPEPPEETATGGTSEIQPWLRRRWLATRAAQLVATGRHLCAEPDRTPELAAVPLPKHVVSGERDDTWPVQDMDAMARRLNAHRTVIADAEHSPAAEQPASTAAALAAFWDGC